MPNAYDSSDDSDEDEKGPYQPHYAPHAAPIDDLKDKNHAFPLSSQQFNFDVNDMYDSFNRFDDLQGMSKSKAEQLQDAYDNYAYQNSANALYEDER